MNTTVIFSAMLGIFSVFQAGLNRRIASHSGLISVIFLNNVVALPVIALYFLFRGEGDVFSKMFQGKNQMSQLLAWYWAPGLLGLALLVGMPFAISKIGALRMFTILIAAEILGSMFWDFFFEGSAVTFARALGAFVSFLGAVLASFPERR